MRPCGTPVISFILIYVKKHRRPTSIVRTFSFSQECRVLFVTFPVVFNYLRTFACRLRLNYTSHVIQLWSISYHVIRLGKVKDNCLLLRAHLCCWDSKPLCDIQCHFLISCQMKTTCWFHRANSEHQQQLVPI